MAARFPIFRKILADLGAPMRSGAVVLDFGCGDGQMVKHALQEGFDAYGCDQPLDTGEVEVKEPGVQQEMKASGRVRDIALSPYRLPFEDQFFDIVISDQVFEHVRNYPETVAELRRVMKPGSVFLHCFPSRYIPIEPHVFVPGATVIRAHWWLMLWALLGIRNEFQHGLGAAEVAARNARYLNTGTNYLRPSDIKRHFRAQFSDVTFVEGYFLRHSRRARFLHAFGVGPIYGLFRYRFIYGRVGTESAGRPR
jgi:SAM-dependent methyltransferase